MAQNITLLGASYSDVPAVQLPKTGGGTASFFDVSDTTAAAADVASGKYFYNALGVLTEGTASGGGGGGFEVESGTYTPSADESTAHVYFAKTHTRPPAIIVMSDTASSVTNSSNVFFVFCEIYQVFGAKFPYSSSEKYSGTYTCGYRTSSGISLYTGRYKFGWDNAGASSANYCRWWTDEEGFYPNSASEARYWRANKTYSWTALWVPTT